ncbi:hypothetical protein HMPREF2533_01009 [Bacteroides fragilis]|uniref:Uncharacterized protein n=1 Tax=Bacteroides fragilis (strain ATCC 25285 / DSM 2151 / CCUG 4856 / JCM 11019 / LMG 10263 / NCTC 9343 / Onslow / VPI 2553 / EN-2) TaxID=272559 RepID=Q5LIA9_BACFN|nr:hypothetical protein HMPREF2530_01009 [Bacteroides fragilis]KXU48826.1 hypothetical protein HMPREF2533_01009 [Bacteroides fragilis]CAH06117.1 hypothetical protein BF9343_0338 [Bacteroides fragilis NCTC 9343]
MGEHTKVHIISGITSAAPTHSFPFFLNIHQDTDGQPTCPCVNKDYNKSVIILAGISILEKAKSFLPRSLSEAPI